MVLHTVIGFEKDPPEDVVTLAVAPIDAVTRRIVQSNVTARITVVDETAEFDELMLPEKPIRNLSGLLVFIHQRSDTKYIDYPKYRVHVKGRAAGYFDPEPVDFTPPEREGKNALELKDLLRIDVTLFPRPNFSFTEETTLLSGVLVRGSGTVEDARISVIVSAGDVGMGNPNPTQTFETRSDERGAFALALRLPQLSVNVDDDEDDGPDKGVPVKFRIETRDDNDQWHRERDWDLEVIEARRNVFESSIDLENPDQPKILLT